MSKNVSFLERAAAHSGNDTYLWERYLNKFISDNGIFLSRDDAYMLEASHVLTKEQKEILKNSLILGSEQHQKVCSISRKRVPLHRRKLIGEAVNSSINEEAFKLLNSKLEEKGLTLKIICAGGFVLQTLGIRATMDVDAFYSASSGVEGVIKSVGDELGINTEDEVWLNNSIANMNKTPKTEYCELLYDFSNLKVYAVTPEYLIGMKLSSGREKDFDDVSLIIDKQKYDDPVALYKQIRSMKIRIDLSDLLGCFGDAYGSKWLASYYKEHSKEILKYS